MLVAALAVGVTARCVVSTRGENYDTLSYQIVAASLENDENVYAATARYNYAPTWSYVVYWLAACAKHFKDPFSAFKWMLTILLTATDVAIAALLRERVGKRAACLFFLNPISIIISGYHRQFDNVALLVGLLAVRLIERGHSRWRPWATATLLGFSLTIKHVLFALPLWLAVRERPWRARLVLLLLPAAIFLGCFLPFWATGRAGIMNNVFLYRGAANAPLLHALTPAALEALVPTLVVWLLVLVTAGLLVRRGGPVEALLIYTLLLVAFSPSITNQALAVVVPALSAFPNVAFVAFTVAATIHLLVDHEGLHIGTLARLVPQAWVNYRVQMALLLVGTLWVLFGTQLRTTWERLRERSRSEPCP